VMGITPEVLTNAEVAVFHERTALINASSMGEVFLVHLLLQSPQFNTGYHP